MDDMVLLKQRQDEFRAGYANWRAGGFRGARGEVSRPKAPREAALRSAKARHTRTPPSEMTFTQAADAARKGESWARFFLHPDSDFYRTMTGILSTHPLTAANLPSIARAQLWGGKTNATALPMYARAVDGFHGVMCHIGVGGFHRSHQAVYAHQLLLDQEIDGGLGGGERWAIVGVALMPWDKPMIDALKKQDGLYTVMGRDSETTSGTVVGSIVEVLYAPDDPSGRLVVERLAHPQTRIVSLTITEKGYCLDVENRLDLTNPLVAHDLSAPHERPLSAVGTVCAALGLRRLRGLKPFTVLSCDNLPGNGKLAKAMVLAFLAAAGDAPLKAWVEARCPFPNTMVDRITPATRPPRAPHSASGLAAAAAQAGDAQDGAAATGSAMANGGTAGGSDCGDPFSDGIRTLVRECVGVEDDWPVIAETYSQWVIEDDFALGRPAWEHLGALFVPDVHPYEMMKLRLLNGGHSAIACGAYLMGHRYVDSAMDPSVEPELSGSLGDGGGSGRLREGGGGPNPVAAFCGTFLAEQGPTVPPVPGVDTEDYKRQTLRRFCNPYIKDTLQRLAEDSSLKLLTTMRDAALDNAAAGRPSPVFAAVVALWCRYLVGVDEHGSGIAIRDPRLDELQPLARALLGAGRNGRRRPLAVASLEEGSRPEEAAVPPGASGGAASGGAARGGAVFDFLRLAFGDDLAAAPGMTAAVHGMLVRLAGGSARELMAAVAEEASAEEHSA